MAVKEASLSLNTFNKEIKMEKDESKELIIYGKQPVFELLRSKHPINEIIIAREMEKKDAEKLRNLSLKRNVRISYVQKANLQKLCGPVLHQGIVAILDEFKYINESQLKKTIQSSPNPFILILDQIQDPHNFGAIIRTAEFVGITVIILPEKGNSSITSTVVKTSAGAVFHSLIHRTYNLAGTMEKLQDENITLIAMVPHQQKTIYETDLKRPLAIVIGNEGKGVRKNIRRLCHQSISIPGRGKVESLNASVSTAVALFETVRQRRIQD